MKVQLLICFLVFLTQEPLTIKGGGRSKGGGPMGSSLPNHDAKDQEDRHNRDREKKKKKKNRKTKGRLQVSTEKKIVLYDA